MLDNGGALHPCILCLGQVSGQFIYQLAYSQLNVYPVIMIGDSEPCNTKAGTR